MSIRERCTDSERAALQSFEFSLARHGNELRDDDQIYRKGEDKPLARLVSISATGKDRFDAVIQGLQAINHIDVKVIVGDKS